MITLENLSIGYTSKNNRKVVAEGINATLNDSELTCLIGPNGIGKSTLLRTLSAFQPPLEGSITIEIPADKVNVDNLQKLLDAKGWLIRKALGIESLAFEVTEDKVSFPWFSHIDTDLTTACTQFIAAICRMSVEQKRSTAREKAVTNEKYAFRCFLLRLGFIGDEYKQSRKILLSNLDGSSAFKTVKEEPKEVHDEVSE